MAQIEAVVLAHLNLREGFPPLLTVRGIGQILGLTIMVETGESGRFATVGDLASSWRCVGSQQVSNGKRKGQGNTQNGKKSLARALVEAANFAVRYNTPIKRFSPRKQAKTNGIVAIKAVAHRLARACYDILRDQVPLEVTTAFA
jgi:transposase